MSEKPYNRRTFLAAAGTVSVLVIAGCADDDPVDDEDEPEDPVDDDSDDDSDAADDEEEDADAADDEEEDADVEDQPDDAAASFVTPEDGDTVESPVQFEGEVEGVELAPAGPAVEGEGHLHILVDHECFEEGEVIPGPSDEAEEDGIYHWGDGQSEGEIELEPGEYDLCLQLADGPHRAFGETDEITITVEES